MQSPAPGKDEPHAPVQTGACLGSSPVKKGPGISQTASWAKAHGVSWQQRGGNSILRCMNRNIASRSIAVTTSLYFVLVILLHLDTAPRLSPPIQDRKTSSQNKKLCYMVILIWLTVLSSLNDGPECVVIPSPTSAARTGESWATWKSWDWAEHKCNRSNKEQKATLEFIASNFLWTTDGSNTLRLLSSLTIRALILPILTTFFSPTAYFLLHCTTRLIGNQWFSLTSLPKMSN